MRPHLAVLCAALLSSGCTLLDNAPPAEPQIAPPAVEGFVQAPPLGATEWFKGEQVDLASAKGVVLVEHWATWCGPCKDQMPHLTELQAEHPDVLTIVGVSREDAGKIKPFVGRNEAVMGYTVAGASEEAMDAWTSLSGASGIPYSYLVVAGAIVWHGHPAGLDRVLPRVLDGSWDLELATRHAAAPKAMAAYVAAIGEGDAAAARPSAQPLLDEPRIGASTKNELSWGILTDLPEDKRDLELALLLAEQATDEAGHDNWAYEDTLGLAYFENGRLDDALAAQKTAVKACEEQGAGRACQELRDRLVQFEAARP